MKNPLPLTMNEKIQKVLARTGVGSRRQIETWIKAGRITINGRSASIGERITSQDNIHIDGRKIKLSKSQQHKTRLLLYNKPEGELCTRHDPEKRPTIFDKLPLLRNDRWISVGRLDFNTSGLLLITNDGQLAHHLMHPRSNLEREYAVRLRGEATAKILERLRQGVTLEDGPARFAHIEDAGGKGSNHWYHVMVTAGRYRLVRRLWESQNLTVSRLIRVRFGPIRLPSWLRRGGYTELSEEEISRILTSINIKLNT